MCNTLWYILVMADVETPDVIEVPAEAAVEVQAPDPKQSAWRICFIDNSDVTVTADDCRIEPSDSTVVISLGSEVVLTAPMGRVQYVCKVLDRQ